MLALCSIKKCNRKTTFPQNERYKLNTLVTHILVTITLVKNYPGNNYLGNKYPGNNYLGNKYPGNNYLGNKYPSNNYLGNLLLLFHMIPFLQLRNSND